jgi:hypothetical protein
MQAAEQLNTGVVVIVVGQCRRDQRAGVTDDHSY